MPRAVVHLLLLIALIAPAWGTTARPRDLKCPVCGTATKGMEIGSTNSFGGVDRDLLRRAAGSQPLLLLPVTCPKCHYSRWSGDFDKPVSASLKKAVLGGALHVATTEGSTGGELAPWVRHDLICQVLVLAEADDDRLFNQYLNTAWAVRLTSNPFRALLKDEAAMERLAKGAPQEDNRAQAQVLLGRSLVGSLKTQPAADRQTAALLAGALLREHGEFPDLLAALPAILDALPAEQRDDLRKRVTASVALEQGYQKKALEHLTKVLGTVKDPQEKTVMLYLAGELYRRLGHPKEAARMYDEALAGKLPEGLDKWIREQRALVAPT